MAYDRDEVLGRVELAELCDEVLGPRRGRGASGTWPCPDPGHGTQTGRTPPVSVFRTRRGEQRWRCHACGAGGTAIDLVMTTQSADFRGALEVLGRRVGAAERDLPGPDPRRGRLTRPPAPAPGELSPAVLRYVVACEAHLWSARGQPFRRWLHHRGLGPGVLRANRVGADPGPAQLPRPEGLPRGGAAAVFPVLGVDGAPLSVQARYLRHPRRRWENPRAALVGPSPRLAEARLPGPAADPSTVLVCEGIPDALSVAQAGHRAVAVLGAGLPDAALADELVRRHRDDRLVVAFDADQPGRAGAARLVALLGERGLGEQVRILEVGGPTGDLNGWLMAAGDGFGAELDAALARPGPSLRMGEPPTPSAERAVAEDVELLGYHHVLVDDPALAAANAARIAGVAGQFSSGAWSGFAGDHSAPALDQALEAFAWRHVLVDDVAAGRRAATELAAAARQWTSEIARGHDPEIGRRVDGMTSPGAGETGPAREIGGPDPGPANPRLATSLAPVRADLVPVGPGFDIAQ